MSIPIDRLDAISRSFEHVPPKSLAELVSESGFGELRPQLRWEALASHFARHPGRVLGWLRYSQDKRASGGWYLMQRDGGWTVGRLGGPPNEQEIRFETAPEACAEFVLRELESMAGTSTARAG